MAQLSYEILNRHFLYEPMTGILRWKTRPTNRVKIGDPVGCVGPDGYLRTSINRNFLQVSRIIWCLQTGEWPKDEIDHINGVPSDNRWNNLRECSRAQNLRNRAVDRRSRLCVRGIKKHRGKYQARIGIDGREIYLGLFSTLEEAILARQQAEIRFHKEFSASLREASYPAPLSTRNLA